MNYAELQTAIADWMNRDDLDTVIPGFIDLCEAEINRQLRTGDQESNGYIIPGVENQDVYDLPTTAKGWRTVKVDRVLRYLTPHAMDAPPWFWDHVAYYTLYDGKIQFNTGLTAIQQIELMGYAQVPALTEVDNTNWLLQAHEDVYLFGSLRYAEHYVKNPQRSQEMQVTFLDKIGQVIERDKQDRWSGDTLVMRSNRPRGVGSNRYRRV